MTDKTSLAPASSGGAIVQHEEAASKLFPDRLKNFKPEDFEVPVIHLFQDAGKESESYGEHPKGTWVDSVSQEAIENPHFIPIIGQRATVVFYERESKVGEGFVGTWPDMASVPIDYKENATDFNVLDVITWIGLVPGRLTPYALVFKSSSHRVGKSLNTAEKARQANGRPAGVYSLSSRDRSNDKGKWKQPVLTPKGDCVGKDAESAVALYNMLADVTVTVVDPGEPGGESQDVNFGE